MVLKGSQQVANYKRFAGNVQVMPKAFHSQTVAEMYGIYTWGPKDNSKIKMNIKVKYIRFYIISRSLSRFFASFKAHKMLLGLSWITLITVLFMQLKND